MVGFNLRESNEVELGSSTDADRRSDKITEMHQRKTTKLELPGAEHDPAKSNCARGQPAIPKVKARDDHGWIRAPSNSQWTSPSQAKERELAEEEERELEGLRKKLAEQHQRTAELQRQLFAKSPSWMTCGKVAEAIVKFDAPRLTSRAKSLYQEDETEEREVFTHAQTDQPKGRRTRNMINDIEQKCVHGESDVSTRTWSLLQQEREQEASGTRGCLKRPQGASLQQAIPDNTMDETAPPCPVFMRHLGTEPFEDAPTDLFEDKRFEEWQNAEISAAFTDTFANRSRELDGVARNRLNVEHFKEHLKHQAADLDADVNLEDLNVRSTYISSSSKRPGALDGVVENRLKVERFKQNLKHPAAVLDSDSNLEDLIVRPTYISSSSNMAPPFEDVNEALEARPRTRSSAREASSAGLRGYDDFDFETFVGAPEQRSSLRAAQEFQVMHDNGDRYGNLMAEPTQRSSLRTTDNIAEGFEAGDALQDLRAQDGTQRFFEAEQRRLQELESKENAQAVEVERFRTALLMQQEELMRVMPAHEAFEEEHAHRLQELKSREEAQVKEANYFHRALQEQMPLRHHDENEVREPQSWEDARDKDDALLSPIFGSPEPRSTHSDHSPSAELMQLKLAVQHQEQRATQLQRELQRCQVEADPSTAIQRALAIEDGPVKLAGKNQLQQDIFAAAEELERIQQEVSELKKYQHYDLESTADLDERVENAARTTEELELECQRVNTLTNNLQNALATSETRVQDLEGELAEVVRQDSWEDRAEKLEKQLEQRQDKIQSLTRHEEFLQMQLKRLEGVTGSQVTRRSSIENAVVDREMTGNSMGTRRSSIANAAIDKETHGNNTRRKSSIAAATVDKEMPGSSKNEDVPKRKSSIVAATVDKEMPRSSKNEDVPKRKSSIVAATVDKEMPRSSKNEDVPRRKSLIEAAAVDKETNGNSEKRNFEDKTDATTVVEMSIERVDFQKLDDKAKRDLELGLCRTIANHTCVPENRVSVALQPGSVKVIAKVNAPQHAMKIDKQCLAEDVLRTAKSIDGVQKAAVGDLIVTPPLIHEEGEVPLRRRSVSFSFCQPKIEEKEVPASAIISEPPVERRRSVSFSFSAPKIEEEEELVPRRRSVSFSAPKIEEEEQPVERRRSVSFSAQVDKEDVPLSKKGGNISEELFEEYDIYEDEDDETPSDGKNEAAGTIQSMQSAPHQQTPKREADKKLEEFQKEVRQRAMERERAMVPPWTQDRQRLQDSLRQAGRQQGTFAAGWVRQDPNFKVKSWLPTPEPLPINDMNDDKDPAPEVFSARASSSNRAVSSRCLPSPTLVSAAADELKGGSESHNLKDLEAVSDELLQTMWSRLWQLRQDGSVDERREPGPDCPRALLEPPPALPDKDLLLQPPRPVLGNAEVRDSLPLERPSSQALIDALKPALLNSFASDLTSTPGSPLSSMTAELSSTASKGSPPGLVSSFPSGPVSDVIYNVAPRLIATPEQTRREKGWTQKFPQPVPASASASPSAESPPWPVPSSVSSGGAWLGGIPRPIPVLHEPPTSLPAPVLVEDPRESPTRSAIKVESPLWEPPVERPRTQHGFSDATLADVVRDLNSSGQKLRPR